MKPDLSQVDPLDYNLATRVNVGDSLTRTAELFPHRTAVVQPDGEITYRQLAETSDRLGHALLGLGLEPGTPVALMMTNSWQMLATYYACARAGLVCMPLNFLLSPDDTAWIINDAQAPIVIADAAMRPLLSAVLAGTPGVNRVVVREDSPEQVGGRETIGWDELVARGEDGPLRVIVDDRDTAQCLYTSGTTSRPKGVLVSHTALTVALLSNAIVTRQTWGLQPPIMLVVLPMFHVTALNTLTMPVIMMGGTVVLAGMAFDPAASLDAIERHQVTHTMMLPMMHAACAAEQAARPRDLSSVTCAVYAMAPMPAPLLDKVDAMYANACVILGSGQTEVVPATVMQWPEHRDTAADSWGPQVPSVLAKTMDPATGEVHAPHGTGEIVYRGPNVCSGYWNNADANAVAFAHGWFHSGDIGHLDDDGVVWFTDRLKDIIKSGGENVSSVQVEAVVLGAPGVAECSVIGVPHERWSEAVCAVVVPDGSVPDHEIEACVIAHAKAHLAGFQVPKEVRVVESLPKTATGKIQKNEVRALMRD
ncbi:MAG: acyl--CoA ligase [Micrococcales bacterium]|nr:acyl--CoA ligase [Micrococcales bacterium]